MLIAISLLLVACSSSSNNSPRVVSNDDSATSSGSVDNGASSGSVDSGTTDSGSVDSGSANSNSNSGLTQTEQVCYGYISKDKLDSILKADMYANDYSSGLGECKYKKTDTTDATVLKGTQVRITKTAGRDWYDKQKAFFISKNNEYDISGIGDEAFGKGYTTIYFLKGGNTWFVDLYTGDESLVPELTVFNKEYNDVNKQKYEDHVKAITKELAMAVDNN